MKLETYFVDNFSLIQLLVIPNTENTLFQID